MSLPEPMDCLCAVRGCGKLRKTRGWCDAHYARWRRTGDPLPPLRARQFLDEVVIPYDGDDCLIWKFCRNTPGYGEIRIGGKHVIVSRLVCEKTNGPPPTPDHHAAHSCGNGHLGCVARRHLKWKTPSENMADQLSHGTRARGERHGSAKLSSSDIREIRALEDTLPQHVIASRYGVGQDQISRIIARKSWGWMT